MTPHSPHMMPLNNSSCWNCLASKHSKQVVARIADRTASQHLRGSRDVIDHVTIEFP